MATNGISTLQYKRDRQDAKLALAALNRAANGRRYTLDILQLPTRYATSNNLLLDNNANVGGLTLGRCWI